MPTPINRAAPAPVQPIAPAAAPVQPTPAAAYVAPQPVGAPLQGTPWDNPELDQQLTQESQYSHQTKDGAGFKGILDEAKVADVPFLKIATGDYFIDIIPWFMGPHHPRVLTGEKAVGTATYLVEVFVHKNVGPNQARYICLAKTLGKPCPICEYRNELANTSDLPEDQLKKQLAALGHGKFPTSLFNIWNRREEGKNVQVLQISKFFFEGPLQTLSKSPIGGGIITYSNWKAGEMGGRHITFHADVVGQNTKITAQAFHVRQAPIPPHILNGVYQLDEFIYIPTYEEVAEAFYSGSSTTPEPEAPTGTMPYEVGGGGPTCPQGAVYGADYLAWEECRTCALAVSCQQAQQMAAACAQPAPVAPVYEPPVTPAPAVAPAAPVAPVQPAPVAPPAAPVAPPIQPAPASVAPAAGPTPIRRNQ